MLVKIRIKKRSTRALGPKMHRGQEYEIPIEVYNANPGEFELIEPIKPVKKYLPDNETEKNKDKDE